MKWEREDDGTMPMMADMNLTPLLDVLLVLVAMLLVMTVPQYHAVNMSLCVDEDHGNVAPGLLCHGYETPRRPQKPAPGEVLNIGLAADGEVRLDGVPVDRPTLQKVLVKVGNIAPRECQPAVYVNPEPGASYKYVIELLAMAQREGAGNTSLPQGRPDFQKRRACKTQGNYFYDVFILPRMSGPCSMIDRVVSWLNPFSSDPLGTGRDLVTVTTVWVLLLMAAASWALLLSKAIRQWRLSQSMKKERRLLDAMGFSQVDVERLPVNGVLRWLATSGRDAIESHGQGNLARHIPLEQWVAKATQRSVAGVRCRMQRGMNLLASIASIAPFVGLFGTVWVLCHVLAAAVIDGSIDLYEFAPRVAASLVLTGLGLLVAVPALMGFNLLSGRQTAVLLEARQFAAVAWTSLLAGCRPSALK